VFHPAQSNEVLEVFIGINHHVRPSSKEAANLAARFAIRQYVVEGSDKIESYDMPQDYFRFMFAKGVEPTNNHNERRIRQCVIDRMITQGTRSEVGQRFHERMWTALATCRKLEFEGVWIIQCVAPF